MNLILLRNGYPMAIIKMTDRSIYMDALEKSSINGNLDDFTKIIVDAVLSSIDKYLYVLG